jgi:hypothetical protein
MKPNTEAHKTQCNKDAKRVNTERATKTGEIRGKRVAAGGSGRSKRRTSAAEL